MATKEQLVITYHDNGTKFQQYKSRDYEIHGPYREWDENGILREESEFVNGIYHNVCKRFSEKGKLSIHQEYHNGFLVSEIEYHKNGKKSVECRWMDNNKIHGISFRHYNTKGQLIKQSGDNITIEYRNSKQELNPVQIFITKDVDLDLTVHADLADALAEIDKHGKQHNLQYI